MAQPTDPRRISRRFLLSRSLAAGVAYFLAPPMRALFAESAPRAAPAIARADHLIYIWLHGGPSHIDSFDPKPGAKGGGPFRAIPTAVRGLSFSEHLPQLASVAQDLVVIRSMTSKEDNHARGHFLLQTGYMPNPSVKYPCLGSIMSHERGQAEAALPNFVSLGGLTEGAGFFGPKHAPFIINGDPGEPIEYLTASRKLEASRLTERLQLVHFMDANFAAQGAAGQVAVHEESLNAAARMIQSPLTKAFEVKDEPAAVRKAYGSSTFGARCLIARRLVEAGVPSIEIALAGWDTHEDNFKRSAKLMSQLDPALSQLIRDLKERHLLDRTLIVCMGEFGRTPRINSKDGRDHHPEAFSAVLAGGGLRTGQVIGATDENGRAVVNRPVQVPDLFATMLTGLGIDPARVFTASERPISLTNKGRVLHEVVGS